MAKVIRYKVEFIDGPLNGAVRYYKSLSSARRAAKTYVAKNQDYPEAIGYEISEVLENYSTNTIEIF